MRYKPLRGIIMPLIITLLSMGVTFAQTQRVRGTITNDEGEPAIGATIIVKGTSNGAATDLDGNFAISAAIGDTLTVSHMELITQDVRVNDSAPLKIVMKRNVEAIDEVIVVAYGQSKKASFTGSAEVVSSAKLASRPVTNVSKSLDGQVSGLMTTSGSGQPGEGASIAIRGFGSINASNAPLIVVDGMPYDGTLSSLNSSDIASITVLKDASAGALYGARGANGVLLITTKSSKGDKVNVAFSAKTGVVSRAIPAYNTVDAKGYMETMYRACYNDLVYTNGYRPDVASQMTAARVASEILGNNEQYNPYNMPTSQLYDQNGKIVPEAALRYNDDWMGTATMQAPVRQEYQASISGSADKSKYMTSMSYLEEDGLLKTTNFSRFTGRVNLDITPVDYINLGANINYSHTNSNFLGASASEASNVWYSAQMMAPIYPVYMKDESGNNVLGEDGKPVFDYGGFRPAGAQNNRNVIATLYDDAYNNYSDNVNAKTYLSGSWKNLKFTTNLGMDLSYENQTTKFNKNNGNAAGTGNLTKEAQRMLSYTWNQLLTYNNSWGEHNIDLLAGHEFYGLNISYINAQRTGFPFDDFNDLAIGSTISQAYSTSEEYYINSYMSRLNYDFQNKYYFSASFRMDASSRFQKDNRWGSFWSVGGNWRLSEEEFMSDISWLNNLSVKASYGVQGNDNIGTYYAWQALYALDYANASYPGGVVSSLENKAVTWESNGNLNAGVSFKMFDRLTGEIEVYNRKTTDMLLEYPFAPSLGSDGYNANVGSMSNKGIDVTLGYDVIKTQSTLWNVTLIASTLNNKITALTGSGDPIVKGYFINKEGYPTNSFYLAKSAGVDPVTGQQLYWAFKKDEEGNKIADSDYITADPTAAANSKRIMGSRIPTVYGSVNSSLRWKNWDLNVLMTYSYGGEIYDGVYQSMMEPTFIGQVYHKNIARSWKESGQITDVPRVTTTNTTTVNDRYLIDASYFAIKNITLGYNFTNMVKRSGIESLRVYTSFDSPLLFTHMQGMDPQASFSGTTSHSYTPSRCLTFGVEIKL